MKSFDASFVAILREFPWKNHRVVIEQCKASDHCRWLPGRRVYATDNLSSDDRLHPIDGRQRVPYRDSRRTSNAHVVHAIRRGRSGQSFAVPSTLVVLGRIDASPDALAHRRRTLVISGVLERVLDLGPAADDGDQSDVAPFQLAAVAELDG